MHNLVVHSRAMPVFTDGMYKEFSTRSTEAVVERRA